jgi:uncharacterized protein (TIGR02611 family)
MNEQQGRKSRLHHPTLWLRWILSNGKRIFVLIAGVAVLGAGIAMLVLPGPGILVIVAGFAILATEFVWAERMLDRTRSKAADASTMLTKTRTSRAAFALSAASLIIGGGVVAIVADKYRLIGITTVIAGLCALAILVPKAREWILQTRSTTDG